MASLLTPINGQAAPVDETSRVKLQYALRGAADSMETPNDMMLRFFSSVSDLRYKSKVNG